MCDGNMNTKVIAAASGTAEKAITTARLQRTTMITVGVSHGQSWQQRWRCQVRLALKSKLHPSKTQKLWRHLSDPTGTWQSQKCLPLTPQVTPGGLRYLPATA